MSSTSTIPVPSAVLSFFSSFPLYTYPVSPSHNPKHDNPTLWIAPPRSTLGVLSADVECLKWQAYIALRGVRNVRIRCNVAPEGGVDGRLPSLVVPASQSSSAATSGSPSRVNSGEFPKVLGARMIPDWVDTVLACEKGDAFEGYRDEMAKNESRAWISLLESVVHSALILANPTGATVTSLLFPTTRPAMTGLPASHSGAGANSLAAMLSPPPAPLSGLTTIIPLQFGERISRTAVMTQFRDAVAALSERLGNDTWFLGSQEPTALDALTFAYIHCLLSSPDEVRLDVARRANLVDWERRVRGMVQSAFVC